MFIGKTDAEAETPILWPPWYKELTHLKRLWYWERWRGGGEGGNRGWDGWMASLTQWTWVWASSRSWWWKGREAWHAAIHGIAESDTTEWLKDKWKGLEVSEKLPYARTHPLIFTHITSWGNYYSWGISILWSHSVLFQSHCILQCLWTNRCFWKIKLLLTDHAANLLHIEKWKQWNEYMAYVLQ